MSTLDLSREEVNSMQELIAEVARRFPSAEDPEFLEEADILAHGLPLRVRRVLRQFRLHEPSSALLTISGYPIHEGKIGRTPAHWKEKDSSGPSREEEMLLVLLGSLLGDVIGWATQQDGRIVHDILPIAGHEKEQLGSGSEELLTWHIEDAFHPYRGDYLGMLCLRNPDRVATTFASLNRIQISEEHRHLLSEPLFTIRPDYSHLPKNRGANGDIDDWTESSYRKILQMMETPTKVPVFSGDSSAPYACLDPYYMDRVEDPHAQEALDALIAEVDRVLEDQVLAPGEICFIDNYQAVHGRKPFRARFDGTDRWLKRINITRDLRRSRSMRRFAASRVIG